MFSNNYETKTERRYKLPTVEHTVYDKSNSTVVINEKKRKRKIYVFRILRITAGNFIDIIDTFFSAFRAIFRYAGNKLVKNTSQAHGPGRQVTGSVSAFPHLVGREPRRSREKKTENISRSHSQTSSDQLHTKITRARTPLQIFPYTTKRRKTK